jgi:hypothetical protein
MNKDQMQAEISRLKQENAQLKKMVKVMGELNKKAFKRQHEAEMRIISFYEEINHES